MTRIQTFQHGCTITEYFSPDSELSMVVLFACLLTQPNFLVWGALDVLSKRFQYTSYFQVSVTAKCMSLWVV